MSVTDDVSRSLAFADIALSQIKALKQAALPRNYEIWYTYAAGFNPELNQTINAALKRSGKLSPDDLDHIYDTFLSPARLTDRIDAVGGKVIGEIESVMKMLDAASDNASSYSQSLNGATKKLDGVKSGAELRKILEQLVSTTREMEQTNTKLEARLHQSRTEIKSLQENLEAVRHESFTDPLTSLANRKFFDQAITKCLADAAAKNEPMALLVTDIDHFKRFNDTFGHLTGDQVLRLVAMSVKGNVKGQDVAARYGGEEFVVILPQTGLRQAITVAEHIRRAVMTKELMKRSTGENLGRITISIGVAEAQTGDTPQSIIERADKCLYAAKRAGRNRVISENDPEMGPAPAEVQKVA